MEVTDLLFWGLDLDVFQSHSSSLPQELLLITTRLLFLLMKLCLRP